MTSAIRPIFLVIKSEDIQPRKQSSALREIIAYDPLRQTDNTYTKDLSKNKFTQVWPEFRNWCKGGARNSKVVLIAHRTALQYRTLLETETAHLKDKLPKTWQVFDTAELSKELTQTDHLPDLKIQFNAHSENEAQALHQVFAGMVKDAEPHKIYESLFKSNPVKLILEMAKVHQVVLQKTILLPSKALEPLKVGECYINMETTQVFDKQYVDRIIGISAYIPSRTGEDAFFNRAINPEVVINQTLKNRANLKSVLSQFVAWVEHDGEPHTEMMMLSYQTGTGFESVLQKESARVKITLPARWKFYNLYPVMKTQYPAEQERFLELSHLIRRFKVPRKDSELETLCALVQFFSGQLFLQRLASGKSLSENLPASIPAEEEVANDDVSIFYLDDQKKEGTAQWVVEDMIET